MARDVGVASEATEDDRSREDEGGAAEDAVEDEVLSMVDWREDEGGAAEDAVEDEGGAAEDGRRGTRLLAGRRKRGCCGGEGFSRSKQDKAVILDGMSVGVDVVGAVVPPGVPGTAAAAAEGGEILLATLAREVA